MRSCRWLPTSCLRRGKRWRRRRRAARRRRASSSSTRLAGDASPVNPCLGQTGCLVCTLQDWCAPSRAEHGWGGAQKKWVESDRVSRATRGLLRTRAAKGTKGNVAGQRGGTKRAAVVRGSAGQESARAVMRIVGWQCGLAGALGEGGGMVWQRGCQWWPNPIWLTAAGAGFIAGWEMVRQGGGENWGRQLGRGVAVRGWQGPGWGSTSTQRGRKASSRCRRGKKARRVAASTTRGVALQVALQGREARRAL